tara:strand:- start:1057 stop:1260 length:204 start_codon:yes stop_codon:yes gene_type:complete
VRLTNKEKKMFKVNQIVKGKVAGHFVVLGFRVIDGQDYAQLKCVDSGDYTKTARGEIALPIEALEVA